MCDTDVWRYCSLLWARSPLFYHLAAELSSLFRSTALRHCRTYHALFWPHQGLLSFYLHFPLLCPPLRNWFSVSIVLQRRLVHSADARRRVIAVMSLSMQSCCGEGPGSSFTIHNRCKPVRGETLVTCCEITGIGLIRESLQLTPLRLTPMWRKWNGIFWVFKYHIQTIFPCLACLPFHWSKTFHILGWNSSSSMTKASLQGADLVKDQAYSLECPAMGDFMGTSPKPFLPKSLKQHQYIQRHWLLPSPLRGCLPPLM